MISNCFLRLCEISIRAAIATPRKNGKKLLIQTQRNAKEKWREKTGISTKTAGISKGKVTKVTEISKRNWSETARILKNKFGNWQVEEIL